MDKSVFKKGILTSYLIGLPTGIFFSFIIFSIPIAITGEGLTTILILSIYGKAIIGLFFSFLIALAYSGYKASRDLLANKTVITTSFLYSVRVNVIIWTIFMAITFFDNIGQEMIIPMIFPVVALIVCIPMTTFTVGLIICKTIKDKIK